MVVASVQASPVSGGRSVDRQQGQVAGTIVILGPVTYSVRQNPVIGDVITAVVSVLGGTLDAVQVQPFLG